MKKLFSLSCILLILSSISYSSEVIVTAKISDVTVYLEGAMLMSEASAQVNTGVNDIRITNLPTDIDEESIQVAGKGNFTINSVSYVVTKESTMKGDSLTQIKQNIEDAIAKLTYTKEVYTNEIEILNANKEIKGANASLSTVELNKVLQYYQQEMLQLKESIFQLDKQIATKKQELSAIQSELNIYKNKNKGELIVSVSSPKTQNVSLELSYYLHCANWTPMYEMRVVDINKNVSISYKAKIYQSSGYDWENVHVTLSTGNPSLNGTVPTLDKWVLRENHPEQYAPKAKSARYMTNDMVMACETAQFAGVATTTQSEKTTSIEFAIQDACTVKSQKDDVTVTISINDIPATYVYRCVPKIDKHAYLVAKITDFAQYNFLSGEASLYLGGKYVGTSQLNLSQTTDTLQLSLGQDNGIIVERMASNEWTKKAVAGKNYKQTVEWTITTRNNKSSEIQMEVQDNIPVSTNASIVVSNQNYDGGTIDDNSIVTWKFALPASTSKTLKCSYMVTYPKTMNLNFR